MNAQFHYTFFWLLTQVSSRDNYSVLHLIFFFRHVNPTIYKDFKLESDSQQVERINKFVYFTTK